MWKLHLCQLKQLITSLNVDCCAWCLELDKTTVFYSFSLKFHFLREWHNHSGFKNTSFYLPQIAQCFRVPNFEHWRTGSVFSRSKISDYCWELDERCKDQAGHSSLRWSYFLWLLRHLDRGFTDSQSLIGRSAGVTGFAVGGVQVLGQGRRLRAGVFTLGNHL